MKTKELPKLYTIADLDFLGGDHALEQYLLSLAEAARRFESQLAIQVRAKQVTGAVRERIARLARRVVGEEALLILNGPEKLAAALGYDGVHWPESSIPRQPPTADSPPFRSAAVHSVEAVRRAEHSQATALVFSPVFRPTWKSAEPAGLALLAQAAHATRLPVYALGGITPDRIEVCLAAGAYGAAVLSGLANTESPIMECARHLEKLR